MPNQAITNLVFEGGSVKGVAYIGALEVLESNTDMSNIKQVAGTSAGAMTAGLLALGCDIARVKELLISFDFKAVLDEPARGIPTRTKILRSVAKEEEGQSWFFSKVPAKTVKIPIAYRLATQQGVYEGVFIRAWMENRIQEQVRALTHEAYDGVNLTFAELHALSLQYPGVFRDLSVVGSNLTLGKKTVFRHDDPETEQVIISDAIRISMSIPNVFIPHHVHYKVAGQRVLDMKLEQWVDGGLYDNYPIDCFDHPKYIETVSLLSAEDGRWYNPETLGFRLVSQEYKAYYEGSREQPPQNILTNVVAFNKTLLNAREALQEERYSRKEQIERTIYIDHSGISMLAFNLSEPDQQALIRSGKEATEGYFIKRHLLPKHSNSDELPSPTI